MSKKVLIIGATSAIAEALARIYAVNGSDFFLVARNKEKLNIIAVDLVARGASTVESFVMDTNDIKLISAMTEKAWQALGTIDVGIVAQGTLPDQFRAEKDIFYAVNEFRTNAESVISCMTALASNFEVQGSGVLAVIGSVAGDRGKASNYLYGSAKSAIEAFTSGLRSRLFRNNVHVLLVKPGFVATAMTAKLNLPTRLTAHPDTVALDIYRGIVRHKDIVYTPWFWKFIMIVIRFIPTSIFKKLKL